ncbi:hypothetical protein [Gemmata sp.]
MPVALLAAWPLDRAALVFVAGPIFQATPESHVGSLWLLVE